MPRLLGAANVKFTVFIVLWWHRLALSDQLVTVEGKKEHKSVMSIASVKLMPLPLSPLRRAVNSLSFHSLLKVTAKDRQTNLRDCTFSIDILPVYLSKISKYN